jgi:hypothetical protein
MFCPDFCAAGAGDRGDGLNVKTQNPRRLGVFYEVLLTQYEVASQ